jgi:hypothetical protein
MWGDFNFPDPEHFWVRATDNILTHLMLPIASALAPVIHVYGADGRQKLRTVFLLRSDVGFEASGGSG